MTRTDEHRPSAIDPADYEYRWAFDTAGAPGPTAARYEAALKASATSVYRSPNRCDHCGARLKNVTVWRHTPTGGHIAAGETCAKETLQVPDRMILDIKRLADWRAGVERPRTPEEWREYRLKEARHSYPETLEFLRAVLDGSAGEKHPWWKDASVDDRLFIGKLARGHDETGRISERVVAVVKEKEATTLERQRRIAAGHKHAPVGYSLTIEGVVLSAGETHDGWKMRHEMVVEGDEGWKVSATLPKSLVVEEGWDTRYEFGEGDRIRFVAKEVERSRRNPYFGWAKRPSAVEVLSADEVARARAARMEAEAEASALLEEPPPEAATHQDEDTRWQTPRSGSPEGHTDELKEKARRLGIDFSDLLRAEERRGRG